MIIYSAPRRGGKTELAVNWVKAHNGVLIVHSAREAKRINEEYELPADQIITADQILQGGLRGGPAAVVAIDNLDLILAQLIRRTIGLVTITE